MLARFAISLTLIAGLHAQTDWRNASPEEHGLDSKLLDQLRDSLATKKTTAFLVVRHDRLVYEWYAPGWSASRRHYTASMAKAIVGGLALLAAMSDGRIDPDDLASKYIPEWKSDPLRSKIRIRHLATHSSGIEDAEQDDIKHSDLPGWKGAFWRRDPDPFSIALREAPVLWEPGTEAHYSNPGMAALAYAVTASLKGAPQTDIRALLADRIMRPLGILDAGWSIGYGKPTSIDGLTVYANWGGGEYTPRAVARIGQLMLHRGVWNGRALLDAKAIGRALAFGTAPLPPRKGGAPEVASGLCWWLNGDGIWPTLPRDAFHGAGAGHQMLLVIPSLDMVVVRNGETLPAPPEDGGFDGALLRNLVEPLMKCVRTAPPCPPSPVVEGVEFAPQSSIARRAIDSDNWPLTWGDDGDQYTSYGDGRGFEPGVERKLSMGFARIEGPPEHFRGINVRSATGEREGDGRKGPKASGMLMAGGALYAWVRNTGNSQLIWSEDRGRTWHWGFRFETSFGSPVFLNFGRNYSGARDRYVYVYSQDGASAYESDDGLVLARAPLAKIRDRAAYEFFTGLAGGRPQWTADIARRGRVFSFPGHCQRSDAVYVPGIKRYLLALGYNHSGAWGLFDAPEPWGPWTAVFSTDYWGLGPTHGYRVPSKWIAPDGKSLYLVFSGVKLPETTYDAFCVRRMTLKLRGK